MGNAKSMSMGPEASAVITKTVSHMPTPQMTETGIFAAGMWYLHSTYDVSSRRCTSFNESRLLQVFVLITQLDYPYLFPNPDAADLIQSLRAPALDSRKVTHSVLMRSVARTQH